MVTVNFYNCSDDKRVMSKTLTAQITVQATFLQASSIIKPRLRLAWNNAYVSCNYMYIPAFNRYYFVDDITADTGGAVIINASIDVLTTYQDQIKLCPAVVTRQARSIQRGSNRSTWIADSKLPITTGRTLKAIEFEGTVLNISTAAMTDNNFVLNVAGGGAITP